MRLILASGSARRPELLASLGVLFEVQPAGVDESSTERDPERLACELALRKASAVAAREPRAVVIGADTLVTLDGRFYGKPVDAAQATETLRALRGRTHQVVSGVAVVGPQGTEVTAVVTRVTMRPYSDDDIDRYVATGSPLDKSGAYAIQDAVFAPVVSYEGCMCSVIGLPLFTTRRLLRDAARVEAQPPAYDRCRDCPLQA
ncbi:MAG: nucleoside triphosphate pyrophosphatase [Dehalococcoidia bacterium]